jgi:hypothetical protein
MFVIPAVATVTSIKVVLNGTKQRVERIDAKVDKVLETQADQGERIANLEGRLDNKK